MIGMTDDVVGHQPKAIRVNGKYYQSFDGDNFGELAGALAGLRDDHLGGKRITALASNSSWPMAVCKLEGLLRSHQSLARPVTHANNPAE